MEIKGHQKTSFIDYPDKISTVVFTGGCNFRCPYCHNSQLVNNKGEIIEEEYIFEFLKNRKRMVDGVCISGGEATLQKDIYDFALKVKELGYMVKLDTNGTNPQTLKKLIDNGLLDYIAMDIKAPFDKYSNVTNTNVDIDTIRLSIDIIKSSSIDYEFRTTVCKELLTPEDIFSIAKDLEGTKRYIIQNFRDAGTILAGKGKFTSYKREELNDIGKSIQNMFSNFKIRF